MLRLGTFSLFSLTLITFAVLSANPPDDADSRFSKALSVQAAMARARVLLGENNTQKAVEILEEQLPKVNGNAEYLVLLRDAYRAYIRELQRAGQAEQGRRYLDRLCILDPSAASDPALKQTADAQPRQFEPPPVKKAAILPFPSFKGLMSPFAKKEEAKEPAAPTAIRALPDASINEDPFDPKNRRETPLDKNKSSVARELLNRGAAEFKNERYTEARLCFEQAYGAEPGSLDACREQWAYCIIKGVSDVLEKPGTAANVPELQKQIDAAIQMAPTKMMAVGQQLSQQLEERVKRPTVTASVTKVRHFSPNKDGWLVADTKHFRIFHKQNQEFAERVAQIAENTRSSMFRKWFGNEGDPWEPICELVLHPTAAAYTQMTDVPGNSPGHTSVTPDRSGRIVSRRMDLRLDAAGVIDAVLPHETTHVVLAGMFGPVHVPRWCDEGIAVLSEPDEKIEQHRRNLVRHYKDGQLFGLKELMELKDYPKASRIGAFYSQSVVLTEFLAKQKDPRVLTAFIRDGVRTGYDAALQKHYNLAFPQLEQLWQERVITDGGRFTAQK